MTDDDISIDEKRVYGDRAGKTTVLVATDVGLVSVSISGDNIGEFGLRSREPVADVAAAGDRISIATGEDVLVATADSDPGDPTFEPTGFGPATAIDDGNGLVAAGDGRVARLEDGEWTTCCSIDDVRAVDGAAGLVAAGDGVHRLDGSYAGLEEVHDVASGPLAATDAGLYRLGNGWLCELDEPVRTVASGDSRGYAGGDRLYVRRDGEWTVADLPTEEPITDVAFGSATYVVTRPGTFFVDAGDGWRQRSLGTPGSRRLAVLD